MKTLNKELQKQACTLIGAMETSMETANEAIAEYNGTLQEMQALAEEVVDSLTDYINDRSERWHEGDAADSYNTWLDAWNDVASMSEAEEIETDVDVENLPMSVNDV